MSKHLRRTHRQYPASQSSPIHAFLNSRPAQGAVAIVIVLIMIAGIAATSSKGEFVPEVIGAPRAVIAQTAFDHGDVPVNQPVETTYTIRNVGDRQLIFNGTPQIRVVEGCCPPAVHLSDSVLNPGEEATIHMQYSMHAGMAGPHLFELTVRTNDPEQPTIVLTDSSNWIE